MNEKNYTRLPSSLDKFLMIEDDGVFYIGHASALVRINKKLFLFDPVWNHEPYGKYWTFFPKQIDCDKVLDKVSAIFISHIHEDHVCSPIINKVYCPIYIKDGRPNLKKRIEMAEEVEPFTWYPTDYDADVEMYFVPHAFNSIDSSVFIRSKDYCVYVGSDNFLSKELLLKVAGDVPRVDVAMVPYAFVHWYPHLVFSLKEQEREAEVQRLNRQSLDQAHDFVTAFRPRTVVPFGNSLFYSAGQDHFLNRSLVKQSDFKDSIPFDAGDFIIKIKGLGDEIFYADRHDQFERKSFPAVDASFEPDLSPSRWRRIEEKVAKAKAIDQNHYLVINNRIFINLSGLTVSPTAYAGADVTEFYFSERELNQWLDGEITFEQAIGTRRFQCFRSPEKYNLKVFEFMNNYL